MDFGGEIDFAGGRVRGFAGKIENYIIAVLLKVANMF